MRLLMILLTSAQLACLPASATPASETCDAVARRVSGETGVPLNVLRAITRVETGRARGGALQPWPWTVNMEGAGRWFDTRGEAESYAVKHFARGARSFDVGCFQINYKWHGQAFASISEMFDPTANARYAARFLLDLHAEFGDWTKVAGAYHSRTPKFANAYSRKFAKVVAGLPTQVQSVPVVIVQTPRRAEPRVNAFPLLQEDGVTQSASSLVRFASDGGRPLFDTRRAPLIALR